ncbi:NAD-dependent epimerase/dehydratase family protein [Bradyrhizobium canariense]|uniref:UDP-glucose 4-epimerase n=1 Tax=Bradyrhizobium canariense TaxID=255045 RepID=A0A1H1M5L9_9BRAD|nr:NAD-dependent epimerase/dehydratase family protein [Bradyrhizobium canariense]SDR82093.1 UDP-glucose 4-epimerase [Bradyrhizobium canariense]
MLRGDENVTKLVTSHSTVAGGVTSEALSQMNDQIRVLVTGSDGFVGRHLVPYLIQRGYKVIAASRIAAKFQDANMVSVKLPDLSAPFNWQPLLRQCDVVVHLAGIAHKFAVDDLYDRVNHQATATLARAASSCGTKQLVFISSIAAQSGSFSDHELTENDPPRPNNAYGRSKLAAEKAIRTAGVPFTILRPVVIYGEGEKGNFATVHKISRLPIPLPFGALKARRSVLSIHNFNSAVETALTNPGARGETFIVSDPTPVTVADLIARHRVSLGRASWLLPVPEKWLELSLKVAGLGSTWERLGCPLVASPNKYLAIGWNPTQPSSVHSNHL